MGERNGRLNAWLDGLPRPALFRACCPQPAFLSFGAAGYHAALAVTLGLGLFAGRSVLALLSLSVVCAGSFFGWALLRRLLFGRESYVLLEHLWVALGATAGVSLLLREPVLPSLDVVSLGVATFLVFGRVGCTFAGCCHGLPSSVGLVYGDDHARGGFSRHLVGVRLFPVQILEAIGLAAIALSGAVALPWAPPGRVFCWVLIAYAVLRFGVEALRGDPRPRLWGLSQARWMAIAQASFAVLLLERSSPMTPARWAAVAIVSAAVLALVVARARDSARRDRLLASAHVAEVRALVRSAAALVESSVPVPPSVKRTRLGVSVGVSPHAEGRDGRVHVSLMLPFPSPDLELACELVARALPEADVASTGAAPVSLLHVLVPRSLPEAATPPPDLGRALFGAASRVLQHPLPTAPILPAPEEPQATARPPAPPAEQPPPAHQAWFDPVFESRPLDGSWTRVPVDPDPPEAAAPSPGPEPPAPVDGTADDPTSVRNELYS